MGKPDDIFERNYEEYVKRLAAVEMDAIAADLGLEREGQRWRLPFFGVPYWVSGAGFESSQGERPDYMVAVILAQYLLRCPPQPHHDPAWVSFKDFKLTSHFTNQNFFASDTERVIASRYGGKLASLRNACSAMGGIPETISVSCDLAVRFDALPRFAMLLLFTDRDDEFPASSTVLFQRHAETYLDPESLAMCGAHLARELTKKAAAT